LKLEVKEEVKTPHQKRSRTKSKVIWEPEVREESRFSKRRM